MPFDADDDEFPEEELMPVGPQGDAPSEANVDTNIGPEALSDAPPAVSEPQAVIGEAPSSEGVRAEGEEQVEPLEFDPKMAEDFEGLLFLGKLTRSFKFLGHQFVIKNMTTDDVLEVGLLQKPYRDSMGDLRAYQAALAAACVVSVDGQPLPLPLTNSPDDTALPARFRYVRQNWYPVVLDRVYEEYLLLESRVAEVVKAMGEALG
jgi:hypothetical protein